MGQKYKFHSTGRASLGTRTKTSSSVTLRPTTHSLSNKPLKVGYTPYTTCLWTYVSVFLIVVSLCLFSGTTRPLYWQHPVYELDDTDSNNNGFINDDLIVWMREAAFPNFKKLYGVLNRAQGPFTEGLPAGNYTLSINYSILAWWRTELVVNGRKLFSSTDRLSVWWQNLFKQLTNVHSHNVTFYV